MEARARHTERLTDPRDRPDPSVLRQVQDQSKALTAKLAKVEQDTAKLLERILDANLPSVIAAYEGRIESLEKEKLLIREKIAESGTSPLSYDQTLRAASHSSQTPGNSGIPASLKCAAQC